MEKRKNSPIRRFTSSEKKVIKKKGWQKRKNGWDEAVPDTREAHSTLQGKNGGQGKKDRPRQDPKRSIVFKKKKEGRSSENELFNVLGESAKKGVFPVVGEKKGHVANHRKGKKHLVGSPRGELTGGKGTDMMAVFSIEKHSEGRGGLPKEKKERRKNGVLGKKETPHLCHPQGKDCARGKPPG